MLNFCELRTIKSFRFFFCEKNGTVIPFKKILNATKLLEKNETTKAIFKINKVMYSVALVISILIGILCFLSINIIRKKFKIKKKAKSKKTKSKTNIYILNPLKKAKQIEHKETLV
jgi:hypothetical protein